MLQLHELIVGLLVAVVLYFGIIENPCNTKNNINATTIEISN